VYQYFSVLLKITYNLILILILPISKLLDIFFFCLQVNFTLKKIFINNFYSEYRLKTILANLQNANLQNFKNKKYVLDNFCNILSLLYLVTNFFVLLIFLNINFFFDYHNYKTIILLIFASFIFNYLVSVKILFVKKKKIIDIFSVIILSFLSFLTVYLANFDTLKIINILLTSSIIANLIILIFFPYRINFYLIKNLISLNIFHDYRFIHFIDSFFKSALVSNIFNINFIIFLFNMNYKIGLISISCVIFNSLLLLVNIFNRKLNTFVDTKLKQIIDDRLVYIFRKKILTFVILFSFLLMFFFLIIIDYLHLYFLNDTELVNSNYFFEVILLLKVFLFCFPAFFIINYILLFFYTGTTHTSLKPFLLITIGSLIFNILFNYILKFYNIDSAVPFVLPIINFISAILFVIFFFKTYLIIYEKFYLSKIFFLVFLMFLIYFFHTDLNNYNKIFFIF